MAINRKQVVDINTNGLGSTVLSFFLSIFMIALSVLLVINSAKSIILAYRRSLLLEQARQEVYDLRLRNLELVSEKSNVMSEEYVETEARDRLSYAKDGEVIVVLPDTAQSDISVSQDEEYLIPNDESAEVKNSEGFTRWWSILRDGI
ncbi:septum formation initiator family protein [Candidatus Dojkabacteria bacterium]|nr:septum formation initiator family protein [Candidatus Dojkabacteria bacterium]